MGTAFFQSIKWGISTAFIIGGIACLSYAERMESSVPLMFGVLSFGGAYIMSTSWRSLPWRAVAISLVFVILWGLASHHVPQFMWDFFRIRIAMDYFFIWGLLAVSTGIPVMTFLFFYFEE